MGDLTNRPGFRRVIGDEPTGPRVAMWPRGQRPRGTAWRWILAWQLGLALLVILALLTGPAAGSEDGPGGLPGAQNLAQGATSGAADTMIQALPETPSGGDPVASYELPGDERQAVAILSHYWPPLGGTNCYTWRAGRCVSPMASGLPWELWVGKAAACPTELPFWTRIILPGGEVFYCLDRGGAIRTMPDGSLWIDLLVEVAPVPYGTSVPITIKAPLQAGTWVEVVR